MLFKYKKEVSEMAEIELQVPYYYEEISDTEYKMFGKLTENGVTEISFGYYTKSNEVNLEKYTDSTDCIHYILKYREESTKERFDAAKKEAMGFLKEE